MSIGFHGLALEVDAFSGLAALLAATTMALNGAGGELLTSLIRAFSN
jgi:hypothetical protein